jgi:hypothetical protein
LENWSKNASRDFSSLSEIMERFNSIPFEQFQRELSEWFIANLSKQGIDVGNLSEREALVLNQLSDLTKSIYHQAEVSQTLSDLRIQPPQDEV